MKGPVINYLALLFCTIILLFSCNRIDTVGFDKETVTQKNVSIAHSIKVTHQEAQGIANMFMHSGTGSDMLQTKSENSKRVSSTATVRDDGQDLMYIFNYEDGGFVIVGATRNYYPILAYSDKGSFVLRKDMGPVDVWLDETKVSIKNSISIDDVTKAQMQNLWARYDGSYVDPTQQLLSARRPQTRSAGEDSCWAEIERLQALYGSHGWTFLPLSQVENVFDDAGLSSYYDDICYSATQNHSALNETVIGYKNTPKYTQRGPLIPTTGWNQDPPFNILCPNHYPAGCTAVAAAQLLYYYEYPSDAFWVSDNFIWAEIMEYLDSSPFTKQPNLIKRVGQIFHMTYSSGGSYASNVDVVSGLVDSLGYAATLKNQSYSTVKGEIFNNRPVLMTGSKTLLGTGHCWVCDGAIENISNQITFFTENQPYGAGTFTQGMYTNSSPGVIGGIYYYYFHMKFGNDSIESDDGWYADNNLPSNSNYQYNRKDITVHL